MTAVSVFRPSHLSSRDNPCFSFDTRFPERSQPNDTFRVDSFASESPSSQSARLNVAVTSRVIAPASAPVPSPAQPVQARPAAGVEPPRQPVERVVAVEGLLVRPQRLRPGIGTPLQLPRPVPVRVVAVLEPAHHRSAGRAVRRDRAPGRNQGREPADGVVAARLLEPVRERPPLLQAITPLPLPPL